jgi:hypothetical protein
MIPVSLRLDIRQRNGARVVLWFAVIILWLFLAALMAAALPFLVIAVLATMRGGPGKALLLGYFMVFAVIGTLSGLRIDVDGRGKDKVFISLD